MAESERERQRFEAGEPAMSAEQFLGGLDPTIAAMEAYAAHLRAQVERLTADNQRIPVLEKAIEDILASADLVHYTGPTFGSSLARARAALAGKRDQLKESGDDHEGS